MVHAPFGMVICAGPTGAGKTTTLYATLQEINSTGKNVTTVEDPVEYVFPGINQIQTNEQAGLTFATGLKAILRQDPDVILVGEIRDADTARIAIQSALTGHFVLSSLARHRLRGRRCTASSTWASRPSSSPRRWSASSASACCAASATPARSRTRPAPTSSPCSSSTAAAATRRTFFHGAGCNYCAGTGYRDRIGVYELLRITPELRRLIVGWATTEELRRLAVAQGMRTMLREAWRSSRTTSPPSPKSSRPCSPTDASSKGALMPKFAYAAIDATGVDDRRRHQGRHDRRRARALLVEQNLYPVKIEEQPRRCSTSS